MGSHRLFIAQAGGDADMVHIAPALSFGTSPGAFLRANVDQIDQRCAGAELKHAIFGQRPVDRAAQHRLIEALSLAMSRTSRTT